MNTSPSLNRLIIGALVLLAVGVGLGYGVAQRGKSPAATVPNKEIAAPATTTAAPATTTPSATEKTPLYYYDPMFPQQKFDKPGKSPFMDMMLVPVYGDDSPGQSGIRISPQMTQNLGVRTAAARMGSLGRGVQAAGAVSFDERLVFLVQAKTSGFIEKLWVRAPFDTVRRGQPLAEILAPEWVAAQEEYLTLKRSDLADAALRDAARQRLILLGMSEATIAAIERDGKTRPRITLTAPIDGVVAELGVREGMTVMPGVMLFRLNGLSSVWVNAEVAEAQAAWIKPGSAVEASVPAYPGEVFKGKVSALLADINATTRTQKARIELINPKGRLVPGMFASVRLGFERQADSLLVPTEAVIQTGKRSVVITTFKDVEGKRRFAPVEVILGAESEGQSEILKGLKAGTEVVLSGQFLIDSEASLKSVTARMSELPEQTETAPAGGTK